MSEDIENILDNAAKAAIVNEIESFPVLPRNHPDCVEFEECIDRCQELAKKNGWVFYGSHFRQFLDEEGEEGTAQRSIAHVGGAELAKVFAQHGSNGVLASHAYHGAVANVIKFHSEIFPALFGNKGRDPRES